MTFRQKILKALYPVTMFGNRVIKQNNEILYNQNKNHPLTSFYSLKAVENSGKGLHFSEFKNHNVLIVNTASDCGYTAQYKELERLKEKFGKELIIIGFPSNDFGGQERSNDEQIAGFCRSNYRISFPIAKKSVVVKDKNQNEVFRWLSDAKLNGWNSKQPGWNFSKYFINKDGVLLYYFGSSVSPLSSEVLSAVRQN
jgi:glutathione peroxidase